jgi:histidinol-phosphatase (PHP family)
MPTALFDMHVHTEDSPDATFPAAELVRRAGAAGLAGIGFVAHLDRHPEDSCHGGFDPAGYGRSLSRARRAAASELKVLGGLEVGEPHRYGKRAMQMVEGRSYDFIIGGLHWTRYAGLVLGKESFEGLPADRVIRGYLEESLEIALHSDIDILAHFGLFRRGMGMAGLDTGIAETVLFPDLVRAVLLALIDRGIALELNCSGLRRVEKVTYPTPAILRLFMELGGRLVTLGSDTHSEPWVFYGLEEGRRLLLETGFREAFFCRDRTPEAYPLS